MVLTEQKHDFEQPGLEESAPVGGSGSELDYINVPFYPNQSGAQIIIQEHLSKLLDWLLVSQSIMHWILELILSGKRLLNVPPSHTSAK